MDTIRNFAIIAHVDHGKSTLADRLLEITHTVSPRLMQNQYLDSNPIERERGITIKLAPVCMHYSQEGTMYTLNLIDTPGHVDFTYEVNRSLAACEGAILLVDATQGVQAQTLAHFQQAKKLGLVVIPVINKIDVATADVLETETQLGQIFGFAPSQILHVSGKLGTNVASLLDAIISRIPPPRGQPDSTLRALVFNSNFDPHLGVVAWIRVVDGHLFPGDKLRLLATDTTTSSLEVGVFSPKRTPASSLPTGQVGYVVTGLKDISLLQIGDTLSTTDGLRTQEIIPLPGYQPLKPVVFVSFYPTDGSRVNFLRDSLAKLSLEDSSIEFAPEFSPALGNGFRVGLLGLLHADIVQERLEREFGLELVAAAPGVQYQVITTADQLLTISKATDLPDASQIREIREPLTDSTIFTPRSFLGPVLTLVQSHRGSLQNMEYLGEIIRLSYSLPLSELIRGLYDELKSVSQGFATIDYELAGFAAYDLVRLDILISGQIVDALSQIIPRSRAPFVARDLVEELKKLIPRQQFEITIQAGIGGHILARSDVKPYRKDVTAKLYGGDQTRKDKLLKKQKKGKARMKRVGLAEIPQEAFLSILKVK